MHLQFTCIEQNGVFKAVFCVCTDYDSGLTQYSGNENLNSRPKMIISWLRPLKALTNVDLRITANKYSITSRRQLWYFKDFAIIAKERK